MAQCEAVYALLLGGSWKNSVSEDLKIYGVLRFDPDAITAWLRSFDSVSRETLPPLIRHSNRGVDQLIEAAKRAVYTPDRERPDKDRA